MGEPSGASPDDTFHLVWLTGPSCDGCTVGVLGDTTSGGVEALLAGTVAGLPRLALVHPALSFESGAEFIDLLQRAERRELGPYALIVEASIPDERLARGGFFAGLGEVRGAPVSIASWVDRLAPSAAVVIALGDCGVWGGPHSLHPNPIGATGVGMHLGVAYRSALGLPVINVPGCCAPPVLLSTLATILTHARGEGPALELDDTNRPRHGYPDRWKGALAVWTD